MDSRSELENFLDLEPSTELLPWLDVQDIGRLSLTCTSIHTTFFQRQLPLARLGYYTVVEPSEVKVKKILAANPQLVQAKIKKVIDHSGRIIINNTVLQLAYGAKDYEMCSAIIPYIESVCGSEEAGREEIKRQLNEKFPEESKEKREENEQRIKKEYEALLEPITQAITNEQFDLGQDEHKKWILSLATIDAITTWREKFAASQPKIIDKGMHFRLETLEELYEAYTQAARKWNYNYKKCALFEDGILSFALLYVSANDAQNFSQGLYYLQDSGEKFKRTLTTQCGHHFYRALRGGSVDFLLSESCMNINYGMLIRQPCTMTEASRERVVKLMSSKNFKFGELYATASKTGNVSMRNLLT